MEHCIWCILNTTHKTNTETRQTMYVLSNMDTRSRNHCCCGKAVLNTVGVRVYSCLIYVECTTHALYYIAICGLSGCTIFCHIIS
jgi:hypothetical protein